MCVKMMNFDDKIELRKRLPEELLAKVTILLQDSGHVSIRPIRLTRREWRQINEKVKRMGGLWSLAGMHSHWSIPWSN
ncbi:MAG: hypothetical protein ACLFVP_09235 [Candidatus Bathyarchaeia archaeon]